MEYFQRQDGETINNHAGGFRMKRRVLAGGRKLPEQPDVELLDGVVAGLVAAVNDAFGVAQAGRAEVVSARFILRVPHIKIHAVVALDGRPWFILVGRGRGFVPAIGPLNLPLHDGFSVDGGGFHSSCVDVISNIALTADDAANFTTLLDKKSRQVRTVLPGNSSDERLFL